MTYRALVITSSNRAARGEWEDTSGPILVAGLQDLRLEVVGPRVVADGEPFRAALEQGVAEAFDLIVTTGGTGHTPQDVTPEMTRSVIERESPGLAEAVRNYGVSAGIPTAILSRGVAGVAGSTLVVNLPGSRGGVKDALGVLEPLLVHAAEQIVGSDHTPGGPGQQ